MPIVISRTGQVIEPMPPISQEQNDMLVGVIFRSYLRQHPEVIANLTSTETDGCYKVAGTAGK